MRWRKLNIETQKSEQTEFARISVSQYYDCFYCVCSEAFKGLQHKIGHAELKYLNMPAIHHRYISANYLQTFQLFIFSSEFNVIICPIIVSSNCAYAFYTVTGAPVAQCVKCWPTDLAVLSSIPARGEIFSLVNGVPVHSLSLSTSHRPDMTEILLKRT